MAKGEELVMTYWEQFWSGKAIWNNTGDTATLRDDVGTLIDEYSY